MKYEIMPSTTMSQIETLINDVFSMAEICKWPSSKLTEELTERISNPLNYKTPGGRRRHSVWISGYAAGIIAAKRSDIWRNKVEFCYEVNGELFSTWNKSNRKTTKEFYDRGEGNILSNSKGRHYWIDSDKPF